MRQTSALIHGAQIAGASIMAQITETVEKEEGPQKGFEKKSKARLKTATVRIQGLRPLLMSSPREVFESQNKPSGTKKKVYDDKEEAEKRAYRDKKGYLCVPARCLMASLIKASRLYKTRSKGISTPDMVKGSVFIEPDEVRILNSKNKPIKGYKISKELVVVQRARIVRCRPLIEEWKLEYQVRWNPELYGLNAEMIGDILVDSGNIGILDWRPRYGIFEVESFKVQK